MFRIRIPVKNYTMAPTIALAEDPSILGADPGSYKVFTGVLSAGCRANPIYGILGVGSGRPSAKNYES